MTEETEPIWGLDEAFDHLIEAADQLRRAERAALLGGKRRVAHEADILARAVDAEVDAVTEVLRRSLRD
jgi:hypothetical protein